MIKQLIVREFRDRLGGNNLRHIRKRHAPDAIPIIKNKYLGLAQFDASCYIMAFYGTKLMYLPFYEEIMVAFIYESTSHNCHNPGIA